MPGSDDVTLRPLTTGDVGWVVERHDAIYSLEQRALHEAGFEGASFREVIAGIASKYRDGHDPRWESAWIATVAGERAGCVYCVRWGGDTAQLRLLFVDSPFRGLGVGAALIGECLEFARAAGYRRITLLTNESQTAARRLYEIAGFEFSRYEENPAPAGQIWMTLAL